MVHAWVGPGAVACALLAHALCALLARAASGLVNRPTWHTFTLGVAVALTAAGLCGLVFATDPFQLCSAMAVLGLAFGLAQNPSFLLLLRHSPGRGTATVSSLWNLAYDAGLGLGAIAFGLAAQTFGGLVPLLVFAVGLVGFLSVIAQSTRPQLRNSGDSSWLVLGKT